MTHNWTQIHASTHMIGDQDNHPYGNMKGKMTLTFDEDVSPAHSTVAVNGALHAT